LVVAEAVCHLDIDDSRRLHASSLGLEGAFLLSLRPPAVGTTMTIVFYPLGTHEPLLPIQAMVTSASMDPSRATRCGFEVLFLYLDDDQMDELSAVVRSLEQGGLCTDLVAHRQWPERRRDPRVPIDLMGVLKLAEGNVPIRVINMSMSGALMVLESPQSLQFLPLGGGLSFEIQTSLGDALVLKAHVVRHASPDERVMIGVKFTDQGRGQRRRLEELLLFAMVKADAEL